MRYDDSQQRTGHGALRAPRQRTDKRGLNRKMRRLSPAPGLPQTAATTEAKTPRFMLHRAGRGGYGSWPHGKDGAATPLRSRAGERPATPECGSAAAPPPPGGRREASLPRAENGRRVLHQAGRPARPHRCGSLWAQRQLDSQSTLTHDHGRLAVRCWVTRPSTPPRFTPTSGRSGWSRWWGGCKQKDRPMCFLITQPSGSYAETA